MRSRYAVCGLILGSALAIGSNAIAQTNNDPRTAQLKQEQDAKLPLVESILAREEAASGKAFDPRFRALARMKLFSRSLGQLESIQSRGSGLDISPKNYGDSAADLMFTPVVPCRIIDTRIAGGPIPANTTRDFQVSGNAGVYNSQGGNPAGCGIPFGPTTAAAINFVAVTPAGAGDLRVTPKGTPMPLASFLNYAALPGLSIANEPVVAVCNPAVGSCPIDITVQADKAAVQIVADVFGFFKLAPPTGRATALVFRGTTPSFDATFTRNFTAVSQPSLGIYCLTPAAGIDPTVTSAFATVEWGFSSGNSLAAFIEQPEGDCTTAQYEVQTYDFTGALTNNVAFQIFVP
jgi:hypothetical protein